MLPYWSSLLLSWQYVEFQYQLKCTIFWMVYCDPNWVCDWYKEKRVSFVNQLSRKHSIMYFYWKVQKQGFTRIFIFLLEFQLITVNIVVTIFKFITAEKVSINLKLIENMQAFHRFRFCFKLRLLLIIWKWVCHKRGWFRPHRDSNQLKRVHNT